MWPSGKASGEVPFKMRPGQVMRRANHLKSQEKNMLGRGASTCKGQGHYKSLHAKEKKNTPECLKLNHPGAE